MTVRWIRHNELPEFIKEPLFTQAADIPISRRRARSQFHNPRAQKDDVVLILLLDQDHLLGYLGLLPDLLFIHSNPDRVAWMSCIWVSPKARGQGVAKRLLAEAHQAWDGRLLATEFTGPAKKLYDKSGYFYELSKSEGRRFYLRANFRRLLAPKNRFFHQIRHLLSLVDPFLNFFNDIRLSFFPIVIPKGVHIEAVSPEQALSGNFLSDQAPRSTSQRDKTTLNWLNKHPWLANDEEAKQDQDKYAFSVLAKHFKQQWYTISTNDQQVGLFLLSVRDQHLKVPYFFVAPNHQTTAAHFILREMIRQKINMLTTYQRALIDQFSTGSTPFYQQRPFFRGYLVGKKPFDKIDVLTIHFQEGDGDCGFT